MEIRPATTDDLDGLVASSAALFAEDGAARDSLRNVDWPATHGAQWCSDLLTDPRALVLVAGDEVGGHLIGAFTEPSEMWTGSRAELVSMYVRNELRGQGIGGQLVDAFVDWAKERGAARLHVTAYADNDGALALYKSRGFAPKSITLAVDL
ncbi:GNAT family N-acetyltransferase [Streptomyces sp. SID13031]|uniref:GNAT family N-acetyltransferase n=1 Tax=Streptomyces sp. SID13031 TaxID=2706046 RepID=UPI0013CD0678|nr:GNAT family N-acetyltransferase [Streptomyces sp. SID13031]